MRRNHNRYYLRIDGKIVTFDDSYFLETMDNFLKLSLFTGIFKNQNELTKSLYDLGLIARPTCVSLEIVKRIGNRETGYDYVFVTDAILYKKAVGFLSGEAIKDFLFKNRDNYKAMTSLFEKYLDEISRLVSTFEIKIRRLKRNASLSTGEELEVIYNEIAKKENSLRNFNKQQANIEEIIRLITVAQQPVYFDRECCLEYLPRISDFIMQEITYRKGNKLSINERGLVKLAVMLASLQKEYPELQPPIATNVHMILSLEIMKSLKTFVEEKISLQKQERTKRNSEPDIEPDSFMFLEEEDFTLPEFPSKQELEAYEDSIEGLRFKKKDFQ